LRIVFMGSPEFAAVPLERLVLNRYQIAAVYTQPDRPSGRGRSLAHSPVKRAALELGLKILQPPKLKAEEATAELRGIAPDVIVVAAFGQILPKVVLELPRYGCINIHPSLLPRFRGSSPIPATILSGDRFTGVSIMKMDEGLDTGPILVQSQIPVTGYDDTGSLTRKLSSISADMIQDTLVRWVRGEITPRPQTGTAAYAPTINKEQGEIDWNQPAANIWRQVRAYQPWPGAFTRWQSKRLEIIRSIPLPWPERIGAGQVVDLKKTGVKAVFGIGTGDGVLGVLALQVEGRRATTAEEFVRGQRNFIGAKLPS